MQKAPTDSIYIPGTGQVRLSEYRIHRALQEYDDRLMFGRNERTGEWCAFVKMPHGQNPVAVLGFGSQLPSVEEALKRVQFADTRRYASEIQDQVTRANERLKEQKRRDLEPVHDFARELAEAGARKLGIHPKPRVFMHTPKKSKVARGYE